MFVNQSELDFFGRKKVPKNRTAGEWELKKGMEVEWVLGMYIREDNIENVI